MQNKSLIAFEADAARTAITVASSTEQANCQLHAQQGTPSAIFLRLLLVDRYGSKQWEQAYCPC
jgi:hypothetical protein